MSTVAEIEAALEQLPSEELSQIAAYVENLRARRCEPNDLDAWLTKAKGSASPGVTTDGISALTRGEE